jgi:FtsH-binding integral membrane protein
MKSVYSTIALCLMAFALFCVVFALTLANYNEIRPLALVAFISIAMSLWFLHDGGAK